MSKLTNAQREALMEKVLRETFEARFAALAERVTEYARQEVAREHPVFVKLAADPESRQYLAVSQSKAVYLKADDRRTPWRAVAGSYAACNAEPYLARYLSTRAGLTDFHAGVDAPAYVRSDMCVIRDPLMVAEYHVLWADFAAAQKALRETVYAYSSRPKFEADFPDLAKYLPPEVGPRTAVAVPVEDLRAKLTAVGIPPAAD